MYKRQSIIQSSLLKNSSQDLTIGMVLVFISYDAGHSNRHCKYKKVMKSLPPSLPLHMCACEHTYVCGHSTHLNFKQFFFSVSKHCYSTYIRMVYRTRITYNIESFRCFSDVRRILLSTFPSSMFSGFTAFQMSTFHL